MFFWETAFFEQEGRGHRLWSDRNHDSCSGSVRGACFRPFCLSLVKRIRRVRYCCQSGYRPELQSACLPCLLPFYPSDPLSVCLSPLLSFYPSGPLSACLSCLLSFYRPDPLSVCPSCLLSVDQACLQPVPQPTRWKRSCCPGRRLFHRSVE